MKSYLVAASVLLAALPAGVAAQEAGDIQIRAFGTAVLPNGEITDVNVDNISVPVGTQTRATDSVVPTIAAEYFVADNFSIETICCITPHDVEGSGAIDGLHLIDDAIILPASVTGKLHFDLGGFKPYVGGGVTHFFIFGEDPGSARTLLDYDDVDLSDEFGFLLQAGVDFDLDDRGFILSFDAKRYFVDTTATFRSGDAIRLQTEHELDPWVVSAGVGFRF